MWWWQWYLIGKSQKQRRFSNSGWSPLPLWRVFLHHQSWRHQDIIKESEVKWKSLNCVQLLVTPWTIQFMEFSRPEYWSGYFSLLQGIFPTQELNTRYLTLQADSLPAEPQGKPRNTGVGCLIPSPADLLDPGIKLESPALQVDSLPTELSEKTSESRSIVSDSLWPHGLYRTGVGSLSLL